MNGRAECLARDGADPLAPLRDQFALERADERGIIYLDGNSLGVLPRKTAARVREVVETEWGAGLITSWNLVGWITLSRRIGAKIAPLIGAAADEVVVADSTSLNLYKILSAAIARLRGSDSQPLSRARPAIVSERTNFPTDLYIADSLARAHGFELVLIDADDISAHLEARPAILMLTHVNYRTGRMHRMAEITRLRTMRARS